MVKEYNRIVQSTRDRVLLELGAIGANQSRLQANVNTLQSCLLETRSAAARIQDADIALESANYMRESIKLQAGTALLAQANQSPAILLSLLKDV